MSDQSWNADQMKEFIGAILAEKDRAISMADDEREKAASALRSEQQRREDQATAERGAAAENLRIELARAIQEGDDRLREHITNQVERIKADLESADKLEIARIALVAERADAAQQVATERAEAAERAIQKAEVAAEKRFESVNEFRAQLSDQTATFMPREVADTRFDQQSNRIGRTEQWQAKMIGALVLVGVLVPVLTALAVYALTRHGIPVAPITTTP